MQPSYHGAPKKSDRKAFLYPSGRVPKDEKKTSRETTPLLLESLKIAKETENIASTTMQAVEEQGETIESAAMHVSLGFLAYSYL